MLTYNNDPALKAERIARAHQHVAADRLRPGCYINQDRQGCSVGCDAMDLGYTMFDSNPHDMVAMHWYTPVWLEHLRDAVFERMPDAAAMAMWHVNIAEAIPVGVDLQVTQYRMLEWLFSPDGPASKAIGMYPPAQLAHSLFAQLAVGLLSAEEQSQLGWIVAESETDIELFNCRGLPSSAAEIVRDLAYATFSAARQQQPQHRVSNAVLSLSAANVRQQVNGPSYWAAVAAKTLELLRQAT